MNFPYPFFRAACDALPNQVAIIDEQGTILFVNQAWLLFSQQHGLVHDWVGFSYWQLCNDEPNDVFGIKQVLSGKQASYSAEMCFTAEQQAHWFLLTATPFDWQGQRLTTISRCDISAQKLVERQIGELTLSDSLTSLANRHHFNLFFEREWRRACREQQPLSLLLIDVDRFKHYNDRYGHQKGDECLRLIAELLRQFAKRPSDLICRYGGEEFVIVLGNTPSEAAKQMAERLLSAMRKLGIPHADNDLAPVVTISIGVSSQIPQPKVEREQLLDAVDKALYEAKKLGRDGYRYLQFEPTAMAE
ncbi:diguanylate cyclase domain-containing protein [Ferrimonas senticii]|uniref:diguanylate cyclase domain-containing protein n=1 Tax=Ferrimonas senticii TaxID=394566 RepID=UPI0004137C06|nr:diguanylate cyclase [Ferrimonas senticii]